MPAVDGASGAPHGLLRVVARPEWDGLLRTSGAVAALGIALSTVVPSVSELGVLFSLALLSNGPWSMFLPAAVEPMVMLYARLYPWYVVASVVTVSAVMAEYVDFRLFAGVLLSDWAAWGRRTRMARLAVWMFDRSPFLAVVVGALTPIPFWLVRSAAVLARYPIPRFLVATAVGRFPRFVFYAALGIWLPVGSRLLALAGLGLTVLFALAIWIRRRRAAPAAPDT